MHPTQRRFLPSGCSTYRKVRLRAPRVENPTGHGTSAPLRRTPVKSAGWCDGIPRTGERERIIPLGCRMVDASGTLTTAPRSGVPPSGLLRGAGYRISRSTIVGDLVRRRVLEMLYRTPTGSAPGRWHVEARKESRTRIGQAHTPPSPHAPGGRGSSDQRQVTIDGRMGAGYSRRFSRMYVNLPLLTRPKPSSNSLISRDTVSRLVPME